MGAGSCATAADMPTTAAMAAPKAKHDEPLARCATSSSLIPANYTLEVRLGLLSGPCSARGQGLRLARLIRLAEKRRDLRNLDKKRLRTPQDRARCLNEDGVSPVAFRKLVEKCCA